MDNSTRTQNSVRNSIVALVCKIVITVFSFLTRTIFIQYLGKEILGIEGLFSNIITILNLADLGISTAIIFLLYKHIADKNEKKTAAIIAYLNKFYIIIGCIVLGVGLLLIPILPSLINLDNPIPNLNLYYVLTLLTTSSSYFFASRRVVFEANQNSYILNIIDCIVSVIATALKLIILFVCNNYAIYLSVTIIMHLVSNITIYTLGNKFYPSLKLYKKEALSKDEKKDLYKNVTAVMSHKIGGVLVTGTDNILISVLLNTILVAIYSNYFLIINSFMSIIVLVINAITPSVGNLKECSHDIEHDYSVYKQINFATFWLVSITAICMFVLFNTFISTWLDSSFLFDLPVVFLLCFNYYISMMRFGIGAFATAAGYFKQTWFKPYLEGIINLIVSILLAPSLGVAGIFLGTTFSLILGSVWIDPVVTFKRWFKKAPIKYFITYTFQLIILCCVGLVCHLTTNLINISNSWLNFITKGCSCFILSNLIYLLIFFNTNNFKSLLNRVLKKKSSID